MDIFYHWKTLTADVKDSRTGRFTASRERLSELQVGYPDYIWAFKTPKGSKGQLQLLARLVWADKPPKAFRATPGDSYIFYEADHPQSVWFDGGDDEASIAGISNWIVRHLPGAVSSNFQGINGQHAMRGAVLAELVDISNSLRTRQFQLVSPAEA